jgi:hypothetical protein
MLFVKYLRDGVRSGAITTTVRVWRRPHVTAGKQYRMEEGAIEVDSIAPITFADITPQLARACGFQGVADLLKVAKHGSGENVYLVRFHYIPREHKEQKEQKEMKKSSGSEKSPSRMIDERIEELDDWRGEMLARLRTLIKQADPKVVEEWKWSVPVWSHDGLICTGETYKKAVKLTFAKGAALDDPAGLFNSSLEGNTRRAIDFHEGDKIDSKALKALIRAAVKLNLQKATATKSGVRRP